MFGSTDIQDALINCLARRLRDNDDTPLKVSGVLDTAMRRINNVAASRELSVLDFDEISALIDEILHRVEDAQA